AAQQAFAQSPSQPHLPQASAADAERTASSVAYQPAGQPLKTKTIGQTLTVTSNVLGGYDDNAGAQSQSAGQAVPTNGSTGLADVMLEYLRVTRKRRIGVRTLGNVVFYPNYLDKPAPGAKARIFGTTELGRHQTLEASAQVRYEPLFFATMHETSSADGAADLTHSDPLAGVPATGLFERRSWVSSIKAYLTRHWTSRDRTVVSYLYFAQRFEDHSGDNRYQEASADYSHRLGRRTNVGASYSYQSGESTDYSAIAVPSAHQTLAGQAGSSRLLGGHRQLTWSGGAGATRASGIDSQSGTSYDRWAPYGTASGALGLTRAWKLDGGYRRTYSVLQGVGGQVYSTDNANVGVSGRFTSRMDLSIGGTFANGRTLLATATADTFTLYGATAQTQVALTSTLAAVANYSIYSQRYSNPAVLPKGFPAHYDRNVFTVGFTFSSSGHMRVPSDW